MFSTTLRLWIEWLLQTESALLHSLRNARGAKDVLKSKRYLRRERVAISHNSERKSAGSPATSIYTTPEGRRSNNRGSLSFGTFLSL